MIWNLSVPTVVLIYGYFRRETSLFRRFGFTSNSKHLPDWNICNYSNIYIESLEPWVKTSNIGTNHWLMNFLISSYALDVYVEQYVYQICSLCFIFLFAAYVVFILHHLSIHSSWSFLLFLCIRIVIDKSSRIKLRIYLSSKNSDIEEKSVQWISDNS